MWSRTGADACADADIQSECMPTMDRRDVEPGVKTIDTLIGMFRTHDCPVIRVHHEVICTSPTPSAHCVYSGVASPVLRVRCCVSGPPILDSLEIILYVSCKGHLFSSALS